MKAALCNITMKVGTLKAMQAQREARGKAN